MMTRKLLLLVTIAMLIVVISCTPQQPETPLGPAIETQITATTTPDTGTVGEKMEFGWAIDAEEGTVVMSTAVHYGTESTPGVLGEEVSPADIPYVSVTTAHISAPLPGTFTTSLYPTSEGTLYYRFHAVIDGKNYWSDEYSAEVAPLGGAEEDVPVETPEEETPAEEPEGELTEEPAETVPDYVITINDFAFSPKVLTIGAGDTVQWKNNRTVTTRGIALLVRAPTSQGYFGWKSPYIYNGETYEYTFGEQGKLVYIEAVLTNSGVTGTITINP